MRALGQAAAGTVDVELRIDSGPWQVCTLATALGPCAWVQWQGPWDATPGRHTLETRTWGREGVQAELAAAPYPDGARGYHRIAVDVESTRNPQRRQVGWWLASDARARGLLAWRGITAWRRHRPHRG